MTRPAGIAGMSVAQRQRRHKMQLRNVPMAGFGPTALARASTKPRR